MNPGDNPAPGDNPTPEEIAQHYKAAMDSVNLINSGKPEGMDEASWVEYVDRNVRHLEIMVAKPYWTTEDLTPFHAAIAKGKQRE